MIDTDKYEGHTEGEWYAYDGTDRHGFGWEVLLPTHKNKSQSINVTHLDKCMVGVRKNRLSKVDAQLIADAPKLLAEVKQLREQNDMLSEAVIEDNDILRKHIETLEEVKRLREAIADIANNMEAADASYMGGFIEDLRKVIE
jgi:hypothetical protein